MSIVTGTGEDHEAAVHVWRAANVARLLPPSAVRVAHIWEKLADPDACLVIGRLAASGDVLEPYDAVDPGVERARPTPVRRSGIPNVRPWDRAWRH